MYFYAFDQCFQHVLDGALQNPKNMLKSYLLASKTENRIEKLLLVRFLLSFLFNQIVEK